MPGWFHAIIGGQFQIILTGGHFHHNMQSGRLSCFKVKEKPSISIKKTERPFLETGVLGWRPSLAWSDSLDDGDPVFDGFRKNLNNCVPPPQVAFKEATNTT